MKKPAMVPRHAAMRRPASTKYWGMARNHLYSGFQRVEALGVGQAQRRVRPDAVVLAGQREIEGGSPCT